jgi:hypothetical protein
MDAVSCSHAASALADPLLAVTVGLGRSTRDWFPRQCFLELQGRHRRSRGLAAVQKRSRVE